VQDVKHLSPNEIPEDAILIDVRDELEAAAAPLSSLSGNRVVTVPLAELEDGAQPELPLGAKVIVVCGNGNRAELAGAYLEAGGFETVSLLEGGARGWRREFEAGVQPQPNSERNG
jgi:rhodanese-related sulfurtransferase